MSSVVPWGLARALACGRCSVTVHDRVGVQLFGLGETQCLAQPPAGSGPSGRCTGSRSRRLCALDLEGPRRQGVLLVLLAAVSVGPG